MGGAEKVYEDDYAERERNEAISNRLLAQHGCKRLIKVYPQGQCTGIDLDSFCSEDNNRYAHNGHYLTLGEIMRRNRLTQNQKQVLRVIAHAQRRGIKITQVRLAEMTGVTQQAISYTLARIRNNMHIIKDNYNPTSYWQKVFERQVADANKSVYHKRRTPRKLKNPKIVMMHKRLKGDR